MSKEIIVNSTLNEVRVAILENGNPAEIYVERAHSKNVAGNIYKGRVIKVLPGIQSAFVDVGLPKAAFLPAADVYVENGERVSFLENNIDSERTVTDIDQMTEDEQKNIPPIEDMLKEGQEIVVQVAKEAIGQKGARLTTHLTVPGRYIVLMPGYEHVGVSRKIEDEQERDRLRDVLKAIKSPNMGLIARTVTAGHDEEELRADVDYLSRLWSKIKDKMSGKSPCLIYEDHGLVFRILRDAATSDVSRIVIDNKAEFLKIKSFLREFLPDMNMEVSLFTNDIPIFDYYNIEIEIGRILDKKVWLKSGGYIIIDQAEALTVVDVNTGKFVGKRNFEDTILKTNLEASKEIAWQLKLRNIGGIIIVDFIDMAKEENQQKVMKALEHEMKSDRAKASVVNISPLGLVEITRKRVQESLSRVLSEACPYCEGRGLVKSKLTICYDILREVRRIAPFFRNRRIVIEAHPDVVDIILDDEKGSLGEIELMMSVNVEVNANHTLHIHDYEVTPLD
ncbi:ribonuclease, Rne/Rng family [Denitrovibrio acetiphilus DSM 12809]|uniref:Ribonuclease G n=1 Tax=Denitrovibrio acetiphilus (strain DSM 12809 / NBRC 114555 / N2460) TaxID=522772 RepID=D4H3N2_DENA2|nr:Rne/Rng family ribonuclease [Denitrovibrio acetiphilus]ADD69134.1 ribonuclease, Rne/Rng family [Denitrovibrio acetiphilus DSM 12809]